MGNRDRQFHARFVQRRLQGENAPTESRHASRVGISLRSTMTADYNGQQGLESTTRVVLKNQGGYRTAARYPPLNP